MASAITLTEASNLMQEGFYADNAPFQSREDLNEWHKWYAAWEDEHVDALYQASMISHSFENLFLQELQNA